jgi:peptidoglycan/xylan/chitin deacetylase (PgdA/CDA1 family)
VVDRALSTPRGEPMVAAVIPRRVMLAHALDRLGVVGALLELRRRARWPWRWLTAIAFHRVAPAGTGFDPDVIDATPEAFERQVALLARHFTLVDTRDLDAWRAGATPPDNPAMITFDDGYKDNLEFALPILQRHGARAVFFVSAGHITDRRLFWWERVHRALGHARVPRLRLDHPAGVDVPIESSTERRRAVETVLQAIKTHPGLDLDRLLDELDAACGQRLPREGERAIVDRLIMTWDDVRALQAAGMDVESHGREHRVLETLGCEGAERDLRAARQEIEAQIDRPVCAVAYPVGASLRARPDLRHAVERAGYRVGLTTGGLARIEHLQDWLDVPRMTVDGQGPEAFFRACVAAPPLAY